MCRSISSKLKSRLFDGLESVPCCFCGINCRRHAKKMHMATIEHIIPKAMGGPNGVQENMAISCYPCNMERATADFIEFRKFKRGELGFVPENACEKLIKKNKKIRENILNEKANILAKKQRRDKINSGEK